MEYNSRVGFEWTGREQRAGREQGDGPEGGKREAREPLLQ